MLFSMDKSKLIATGLTPQQAEAYALLLETGSLLPTTAASQLKLTRSNAYKVLDKLVELGLADKKRSQKKTAYRPSNPFALTSLVARQRSEVVLREEAVNNIMNSLVASYYKHTEQPAVEVVSGKQAVIDLYRKQIALHEDIYFIHTPADVAMIGFDAMHEIRVAPARQGNKRYGILKAPVKGPVNYEPHKRSKLEITWAKAGSYDSPVEWSVSGSMLLIILFGQEPHAITIINPVIADAFRQLWHIMDLGLRSMPDYKDLPRTKNTQRQP